MNAILLGFFLLGAPGAPASQPAPAGGALSAKPENVRGELMLVIEIGDHLLKAEESWQLQNNEGGSVPAEAMVLPMPEGTRLLRLADGEEAFVASEDGSRISPKLPIPPGRTKLAASYRVNVVGRSISIRRRIPFQLAGGRVVFENIPSLKLASNLDVSRRVQNVSGRSFVIFDLGAGDANTEIRFDVSGLPFKSSFPEYLVLGIAFAILLWMIYALITPAGPRASGASPMSAAARKLRIVRAIELLQQEHEAEKISEKRYERRHADLVRSLATVLRELDLEARKDAPEG